MKFIILLFANISITNINTILSVERSAVRSKKKKAKCKEVIGMSQNLLPGRICDMSSQCRSLNCYDKKKCKGTSVDKNC